MTRPLAVLCKGFQGLPHQIHVPLVDIKSQQTETSCGAPADAVQELKGLTHQIVVCLVVLVAQKVLKSKRKKRSTRSQCWNTAKGFFGAIQYLQVRVVVFAKQLEIPEDRFHDGDGLVHLSFLCHLLGAEYLAALAESLQIGDDLPPVGIEGPGGHRTGLLQLPSHVLFHLKAYVFPYRGAHRRGQR